ncbi:MAG: hypothetical protein IJM19_00470 [Ruminococcus sp.]|nr:hypothetical protein [Ruminococcus sp.]
MAEGNFFLTVMDTASNLPLVNVERDSFLRKQFVNSKYDVYDVISRGPVSAGVPKEELRKIAKGVIRLESTQVTLISTAAGLPGGLAMIGTVPADMAQYIGYLMRVAQKLMYLYGIESIKDVSDNSENAIIIALGVMLGAEGASNGLRTLCKSFAVNLEKRVAQKALTKGTLYPIVKKICAQLGIKLTKQSFAKGVGKVVPIIGGFASGGLTLATFVPSCKHLLNALEKEMYN